MCAKNNNKIQHLGHFFRHELGKNYNFTCFGKKNKINWDLIEILRNFADFLYVFL